MNRIVTLIFLFTFYTSLKAQLYFPPLSGTATWESTSPESLGWCTDKIDSLYHFLETENTKGFIVLKDGKIVLEKYFGSFTADSLWYWASAGKTITSYLIGKAEEQGYLNLTDKSSDYLGRPWTYESLSQEDKITIWHQLTMTSGLDDDVTDNHCILDSCLIYLADAGDRWAYHNAPYTLLEQVITNATSQNINSYTQNVLKSKIGMNGLWLTLNYDNVYFSNVRSMARFGLLFHNNAIWDGDTLLNQAFVNAAINTSQSLNKSYGYLWWLNGQESFMLPSLQNIFPGSYAPDAPDDMFAGLGKNGQFVCVSKSKGLVVVRMGNPPTNLGAVPVIFLNQMWQKLNNVMCTTVGMKELPEARPSLFPNPSNGIIHIASNKSVKYKVQSLMGVNLLEGSSNRIDITGLEKGIYMIQLVDGLHTYNYRILYQ